jgi:hypothetical protein
MTPNRRSLENLVMRIQSAFLYNPSLALTLPAAQAQFGIDHVTCAGVLDALVEAGVLTSEHGSYRRHFPGPVGQRAA